MARSWTSRRRCLARAAMGWCLLSGVACGRLLGVTDLTAAADASDTSARDDRPTSADMGGGTSSDLSPAIDASEPTDDLTPAIDASDAGARDSKPISTDMRDGSSTNDDANSDAPGCTGDLSNVLNDDFTISFVFQTTQLDMVVALLNQRLLCTSGVFWEARLIGGRIYFEISDINNGTLFALSQQKMLNDGVSHRVDISRRNEMVQISVDGAASAAIGAPQSLTQLPPLEVGTSICESVDTVKLRGHLSDICLKRR